jgi:hypothetical protein
MSLMQQDVIETRIKDSPLQAPYFPGVRSYPYAVLIILPLTSAFNFLDRHCPKSSPRLFTLARQSDAIGQPSLHLMFEPTDCSARYAPAAWECTKGLEFVDHGAT